MQKRSVRLLFLFVKQPFLVGIYDEHGALIERVEVADGKASDIIPLLLGDLDTKYDVVELIYANGPGNQMSIKICYLCLKTFSITRDIQLKSANSFIFNANGLIELANKRFFCFENDKIVLRHIENGVESCLRLPDILDGLTYSDILEPLYILPPA